MAHTRGPELTGSRPFAVQYYGPMGKAWIFDNKGLSGAGPLGPP